MLFSNTITLGNIIELCGMAIAGLLLLNKVSSQFNLLVYRLGELEKRVRRGEELNMVPIAERREARRKYYSAEENEIE